jgi:hypothetical protein
MRRATRAVATCFGILAGIAGLGHGYSESLQGDVPPASFIFPSMGPPCSPQQVWHACEPALTILPSLWVAGILTVLLGLLIIVWSLFFIQRRHGGGILMLLSVALLLTGGGIIPPIFGVTGGAVGTRINKPFLETSPARTTHFVAKLWPWPLVIVFSWLLGQYVIGYFSNDFLKNVVGFGLLLTLSMVPLSVYSAYARDLVQSTSQREPKMKTVERQGA